MLTSKASSSRHHLISLSFGPRNLSLLCVKHLKVLKPMLELLFCVEGRLWYMKTVTSRALMLTFCCR